MKTWPITLTLMCACGLTYADGMPGATPAAGAKADSAPAQTQAKHRPPRQKLRHFSHGDLRFCLEMGNNAAIIRCAEKPPKR